MLCGALVPVVVELGLFVAVVAFAPPSAPSSRPAQRRRQTHLFSTTASTTSALSSSASRWDSFDYLQHWYPVSWIRDLPLNKPSQVSLFDVNYAVAVRKDRKNGTLSAIGLEDRCAHKAAALSEGRITSSGLLQCSYHGWSFDGATGKCVQIPQASETASSYSTRSCVKSVPARIHQGLLWLWPGPVPSNAMGGIDALPVPPTLPELDDKAFKYSQTVREFPCVDWSLLLSNIMDPDHGLFAHQQPPFDLYSASEDMPLQVEEAFEGAGWKLTTKVPAQEKLRNMDRINRGQQTKSMPPNITGTTTFHAPNHVTICRRDDATNETKYISAFWVCPTGTGRSRLMTAGVARAPFSPPRWLMHIIFNNFLDQDTVLVASQQAPVLSAEAKVAKETRTNPRPGPAKVGARRGLFVYQSPTDRSVGLIDQFWDATLSRVPRRVETLLSLQRAGVLRGTPPRRVVLDRELQHLNICPDSQGTVRTCQRLVRASLLVTGAWTVAALVLKRVSAQFTCWIPIMSALVAWIAQQIKRQFFFVYSQDKRDRDLRKIPSQVWSDPSIQKR